MEAALQDDFVPVQAYLTAEETSAVRHEYLGGSVYAMAGETRAHNTIALNLATTLRQHLKGGPCQLYLSDIRVNLSLREGDYYYYPDIVVTCHPRDTDPRFVRFPKLIIEVLSPSTERIDKLEKFFAFTTIESLEEYVLVAQAAREVTVFRRSSDWHVEKVTGLGAVLALASLGVSVPLAEIYEGI